MREIPTHFLVVVFLDTERVKQPRHSLLSRLLDSRWRRLSGEYRVNNALDIVVIHDVMPFSVFSQPGRFFFTGNDFGTGTGFASNDAGRCSGRAQSQPATPASIIRSAHSWSNAVAPTMRYFGRSNALQTPSPSLAGSPGAPNVAKPPLVAHPANSVPKTTVSAALVNTRHRFLDGTKMLRVSIGDAGNRGVPTLVVDLD